MDRVDGASTPEGVYKCAPELLGIDLEAVRRRFISKTKVKRGTSHRGRACRIFVGDARRKRVAKKHVTPKRRKYYANFHLPKVGSVGAHRASYLLFRGPIPRGHEVHHVCLTDLCVEPQHLDPLTPQEKRQLVLAATSPTTRSRS